MKCVFLLVVVGLCVLYMQAPVMNARPNNALHSLHKRDAEGTRQEPESSDEVAENIGELENHIDSRKKRDVEEPEREEGKREHGQKPDDANDRPDPESSDEIAEEKGELDHEGKNRNRRAAMDENTAVWPSTDICYYFYPESLAQEPKNGKYLKDLMENAAKEWNDKAGLNIHYINGEEEDDCIKVYSDVGCWSMIGYQGKGKDRNMISLQKNICFTHGVILHELGHALGLAHEVKRGDRDGLVSVNKNNIRPDALGEYTKDPNIKGIGLQLKGELLSHVKDYDYCSIMHYSPTSFSVNGENTLAMISNNHLAIPCMGSQLGLSVRDGAAIAYVYKTLDIETTNKQIDGKPYCQNLGYVLKDDTKCVCSNLNTGDKCEKVATPDCGQYIDISISKWEKFQTPSYPKQYPINKKCIWEFTAPPGKHVCIGFPEGSKLEAPSTKGSCAFDWLQIADNPLLTMKDKRSCGNNGAAYYYLKDNFGSLVFNSDDMYPAGGFEGYVTYIDGGKDGDKNCQTEIDNIHAGKVEKGTVHDLNLEHLEFHQDGFDVEYEYV